MTDPKKLTGMDIFWELQKVIVDPLMSKVWLSKTSDNAEAVAHYLAGATHMSALLHYGAVEIDPSDIFRVVLAEVVASIVTHEAIERTR